VSAVDSFLLKLGIDAPIIQAPMAGVSTPEMAAEVCEAGGLGSIGVGAVDPEAARRMIVAVRSRTRRPFQVNVFCHSPAVADFAREGAWLERLRPEFAQFGATPPDHLTEIYQSFVDNNDLLEVLLAERPAIVSFHFGIPGRKPIAALKSAGIVLLATATNLTEGKAVADAGIDAVVAQGYEAGGHRGIFDTAAPDGCLGTVALTRLLATRLDIPVIAAGGIMDGAGIAAALKLGAVAAQLGTAFVACPESLADAGYRSALFSPAAAHTVMTSAISGRPARCLSNRFTAFGATVESRLIPNYPRAYDAGKSLHATAKAHGEFGYGAQWAGQGAPLARALPAAKLVAQLREELDKVLNGEPA
jgi:nitronate monooxygenase